jgi:hypothetical protein
MSDQLSLPPTTTVQQDLTHAGQRKVNLIWEYTQELIAIVVVVTTMVRDLLRYGITVWMPCPM